MAKTPHRVVRIDDDLWNELREAAAEEGADASKVIRMLITMWLEGRDVTADT